MIGNHNAAILLLLLLLGSVQPLKAFLLVQQPRQPSFEFSLRSSLLSDLDALIAEKDEAVAAEDYLRAAKIKEQIDRLRESATNKEQGDQNNKNSTNHQNNNGLVLHLDQAVPLCNGDWRFPPMEEVPVTLDGCPRLCKLIKPPDADTLWQWYERVGHADGDPSWAELWPSASSLSAALVARCSSKSNQDGSSNDDLMLLRGKRVVELGSGLGVAGITAACLGAESVLLMDREPHALHCAMSTAALHGFSPSSTTTAVTDTMKKEEKASPPETTTTVSAAVVDWSAPGFLEEYRSSADVVLCSDVLYDNETVVELAQLVAAIVCQQPTKTQLDRGDGADGAGAGAGAGGGRLYLTDPAVERVPGVRQAFCEALLSSPPKTEADPTLFKVGGGVPAARAATSVTVTTLPPAPVYASCYEETNRAESTVLVEARWD